jgi:hypothetical protein
MELIESESARPEKEPLRDEWLPVTPHIWQFNNALADLRISYMLTY